MQSKTVLIAEDQGIISLDLKLFLKANNINSIIVQNSQDLLEQHELIKPYLIIADLNIGGKIDGKEALTEVNKTYNTPIIIISGSSKSRVEKFTSTLKGCTYLLKPFDKSELLKLIQKIPD